MFQYGALVGDVRIEHQHSDGSWSLMEPREPHDPAEYDPEREWQRGHLYVCHCGEAVRVTSPGEADAGDAAGAA